MSIAIDFAELYLQYHTKIYNYIYRRTSNEVLSEDLAAETFAKAMDAVQRESGAQRHVSGWLYRIAHNLVIDHYRTRDRLPSIGLDEIVGFADTRRPDLDYEARWVRERIEYAVGCVTERQQQVVLMRLEGFTFDEIAAEIGTTAGGAKACQHRAFNAMGDVLSHDFGRQRKTSSETRTPLVEQISHVAHGITQIQNCLMDRGPQTMAEISRHINLHYVSVCRILNANPAQFVIVGKREARGKHKLWGLVESVAVSGSAAGTGDGR